MANDMTASNGGGGKALTIPAHLGKDQCGDLRWRPLLTIHVDDETRLVHVTFDQVDGALGIATVARGGTDEFDVLMAVKIDHGGSHALTVGIGHDLGIAIGSDVSQSGGGGSEVNPHIFRSILSLQSKFNR